MQKERIKVDKKTSKEQRKKRLFKKLFVLKTLFEKKYC